MNYETFKSAAVTSMQKYFGEAASVSLQTIIKNNNIRLDGLMIQDCAANIAPAIYLNAYYKDYKAGKPLSSVFEEIIASYRAHLPAKHMDFSFFTDYEKAKFQIIYKLINYKQNMELLQDVPHFRFLDLAVVFCCYLSDMPSGNASILIHNQHLKLWNTTADLLYELASKNTPVLLPYELQTMEDTLKSLCPDFLFPEQNSDAAPGHVDMYVLSNTERFYGASAILYPQALSHIAKLADCDFYVIPSSIHEVLILPKYPGTHAKDINCIIKDVNAAQVIEEEILSDHVYCFDRRQGFLTL